MHLLAEGANSLVAVACRTRQNEDVKRSTPREQHANMMSTCTTLLHMNGDIVHLFSAVACHAASSRKERAQGWK
jgi:hypothetical protein